MRIIYFFTNQTNFIVVSFFRSVFCCVIEEFRLIPVILRMSKKHRSEEYPDTPTTKTLNMKIWNLITQVKSGQSSEPNSKSHHLEFHLNLPGRYLKFSSFPGATIHIGGEAVERCGSRCGGHRGRKVWAGEMFQGAFRGPEVVW